MSRRNPPRSSRQGRSNKSAHRIQRQTTTQSVPWLERIAALRAELPDNAHAVGTETLRVLEDWLYEQSLQAGLGGYSGMREYVDYLAARQLLTDDQSATLRRYIEVRNCLAHRAGLEISHALATELLDFSSRLFRGNAPDARHLMSSRMVLARATDALGSVRDRMLREGISRVPVVEGRRVVGVLTARDLLAAKGTIEEMTVGQAMLADSLERLVFFSPDTPYDSVIAALRQPEIVTIVVTEGGKNHGALLGIITVSDILPGL